MAIFAEFSVGDIVALKSNEGNLNDAQKYCVIDKTDDKVIIAKLGSIHLVSPSQLLTATETKKKNDFL